MIFNTQKIFGGWTQIFVPPRKRRNFLKKPVWYYKPVSFIFLLLQNTFECFEAFNNQKTLSISKAINYLFIWCELLRFVHIL